jgi:hypothetical protein
MVERRVKRDIETHFPEAFIAELPELIPCDVMLGEHVHVGTKPV